METITLYRGVCKGHPQYENALNGIAVPLGKALGIEIQFLHDIG